MRQVGVLAAPGLVALRRMTLRLGEDHERAKVLAAAFRDTGLFEVRPDPPAINMFFVRYAAPEHCGREEELVRELRHQGILTYPPEASWVRFVTHNDVSDGDLSRACTAVAPAARRAAS